MTPSMLTSQARAARDAARRLARLPADAKNALLRTLADRLEQAGAQVLAANAEDVERARRGGMGDALLDRLSLMPDRLRRLAADTRRVADLDDPVGTEFDQRTLPNGLRLRRRRVPLGVLGVIYEARPNVTVDIAALSLKTGNGVILRGGSETIATNRALVAVIHEALRHHDLPEAAVQFVDSTDRALVEALLRLDAYVDMIIPRGGAGLHRLCRERSTIPVITGGIGICHLFVDAEADLAQAVDVVENAKVQRPSVCNALDTLLVHQAAAADLLPRVAERLGPKGVQFRADEAALPHLRRSGHASVTPAGPDDFDQEWLSLVLGVRVVAGLDEAVDHIRAHGTAHSDGILTTNHVHAAAFVDAVDSAAVYVNASTRFTDGAEFGLGAEVAVSTQKLHARGPMGLEALTTYKWIAEGDGHVRT